MTKNEAYILVESVPEAVVGFMLEQSDFDELLEELDTAFNLKDQFTKPGLGEISNSWARLG